MSKQSIILTDEKFQDIYASKEFRNKVSFAHSYHNSSGKFVHKQTCSYPITYIVTDEQIAEATRIRELDKVKQLEENKGNLIFVGMGGDYSTETEIGNHRVRTEFINNKGDKIFIELSRHHLEDSSQTHIDYSILRDKIDERRDINNYLIPSCYVRVKYTPGDILEFINSTYDCDFKSLVVDNYTLSPDDVLCVSPSFEAKKAVQ